MVIGIITSLLSGCGQAITTKQEKKVTGILMEPETVKSKAECDEVLWSLNLEDPESSPLNAIKISLTSEDIKSGLCTINGIVENEDGPQNMTIDCEYKGGSLNLRTR